MICSSKLIEIGAIKVGKLIMISTNGNSDNIDVVIEDIDTETTTISEFRAMLNGGLPLPTIDITSTSKTLIPDKNAVIMIGLYFDTKRNSDCV